MMTLNNVEKDRYSRNILLNEIGEKGQLKLINSSVLIIGAGALGSIVAMYLAASGIGRIGIADYDFIDISNLQRQLSFSEQDINKAKVEAITSKLQSINHLIKVEPFNKKISHSDALEIFKNYDFIIEGSDNPTTKYMVDDACRFLKKPYCFGGIAQCEGHIFTYTPNHSCYRDFFSEPSNEESYKPCSIGGVLGPLPGIIGSIQACEAIKYLTGIGELIVDKLLIVNALDMSFKTFTLK